jgi:CheY-like chemotaxis protein/anti-sigma regulatory factor (Ser/Thr protein kinase)
MKHILVVDDSAADRVLAGRLLEAKTDYTVEYASDGAQALEHMEDRLPVAVVTDLQMPVMDGMQLVDAVHFQFPTVPVVLMTAHGSEDIALQALLAGAADYVPKSRLTTDLAQSIQSVLALTSDDRPHQRLVQCLRFHEVRYELENDALLIAPLVQQLQQLASDLALIEKRDQMRFAKSLTEAMRNAIYHGNLELPFDQIKAARQPPEQAVDLVSHRRAQLPYRDRRVDVSAIFTPEAAQITIRDEGPGFDVTRLPDVKADPSHLVDGESRGLVLIRMFMDEVSFDSTGSEITLVKRAVGCPPRRGLELPTASVEPSFSNPGLS